MTTQVLIADRDPMIRKTCQRYLNAHGFEAEVAADGLQCIEQLKVSHPSVLVLDPDLLWGGGTGVLSWLHDEHPLRPVRVVMTNGHTHEALPDEFQDLVLCRMERPVDLTDLSHFVDTLQNYLTDDSEQIHVPRCASSSAKMT